MSTDKNEVAGLSDAQADGMACVVCGTSFTTYPAPAQVPVGYSDTGSQTFACTGCVLPRETTAPPWEERPWRGLDGPPCPSCGVQDTRWDAISPDYPGDWWECRNDHRFLLDHDGRTWREA